MEIKVGDKVRVIRAYATYKGKVGIVASLPKSEEIYGRVFFEDGNDEFIRYTQELEEQIELVEVANYVPVPKHHKGDIRLVKDDGTFTEVIILENRNEELKYKCYGKYATYSGYASMVVRGVADSIREYTDDELLLEKPSEEKEKSEWK